MLLCSVFYSTHLGTEPAIVKVQGLDCMNDDPSSISVLFAKLRLTDSSNRYVHYTLAGIGFSIT